MDTIEKKVIIIDGNSLINRAFYAINLLTDKNGRYTNGIYGFLNIFFKILDDENPQYAIVAFDRPGGNFRHTIFTEYKGTRKPMPEELRPQIPLLKELLQKMSVAAVDVAGYEADDIIGTLSLRAQEQGLLPVIVSGDRDLLQLATDTVKVRLPRTKGGKSETDIFFADDVKQQFGVNPRGIIDLKALMGDKSDNIPGVPGVGEKSALKVLDEYGDLENALAHAAEIKPAGLSQKLTEHAELARMSKVLATIVTDVPVEIDFESARLADKFPAEAYELLMSLDFKALKGRFHMPENNSSVIGSGEGSPDASAATLSRLFTVVTEPQQANDAMALLIKSELCAVCILQRVSAINIAGLDESDFLGIVFTDTSGTVFIKAGRALADGGLMDEGMSEDEILAICKTFFESPVKKISPDVKSDLRYLRSRGIDAGHFVFDAGLAGYILNASESSYAYNDIAFNYLHESYPSHEDFWGKGKSVKRADAFSDQEIADYAFPQGDVLFRAYPIMDEQLRQNGQAELFYDMELKLADVLADMETAGIRIDTAEIMRFKNELNHMIDEKTAAVYELSGEHFNINSPSQLGVVLFEKLGLKASKKTKQGYSTSAEVLEGLRDEHPVIDQILDYRQYTKLKSTYTDGLLQAVHPVTQRIYSTFNQTGTATGRISSVEPNLQNIPVRLPLGRRLRKAFVPESADFVFVDGDYSQIELRILAHLSGDENMIHAFVTDLDIHRLTASQVLGIAYDDVTPEQRSGAKAVNFGIVYGISAFSLSKDIGVSVKEADAYIQEYFAKYPKIKEYLDDTVSSAKELGYAQTIYGRRRMIPELKSDNRNIRSFGERVAMNMPVQGSAADIIKLAMIKVHNRLKDMNAKSRLLLQVHDELLLEVHRSELTTVMELLKSEMENGFDLRAPLVADISQGDTWYDAK